VVCVTCVLVTGHAQSASSTTFHPVACATSVIPLVKVVALAVAAVVVAAAAAAWTVGIEVACVLETGSVRSVSSITSLHATSASSAPLLNDLYFSPPREHLDQDKLVWRRWNTTGYLFTKLESF